MKLRLKSGVEVSKQPHSPSYLLQASFRGQISRLLLLLYFYKQIRPIRALLGQRSDPSESVRRPCRRWDPQLGINAIALRHSVPHDSQIDCPL
jgi:hypothetical protein